jgi:hypothetical protein
MVYTMCAWMDKKGKSIFCHSTHYTPQSFSTPSLPIIINSMSLTQSNCHCIVIQITRLTKSTQITSMVLNPHSSSH